MLVTDVIISLSIKVQWSCAKNYKQKVKDKRQKNQTTGKFLSTFKNSDNICIQPHFEAIKSKNNTENIYKPIL